jgi:hypothetical protein
MRQIVIDQLPPAVQQRFGASAGSQPSSFVRGPEDLNGLKEARGIIDFIDTDFGHDREGPGIERSFGVPLGWIALAVTVILLDLPLFR